MRGRRNPQITMLAFIDLEERVLTSHALRTVERLGRARVPIGVADWQVVRCPSMATMGIGYVDGPS